MKVRTETYRNYMGRYWVVVDRNGNALSGQLFSPAEASKWIKLNGYQELT